MIESPRSLEKLVLVSLDRSGGNCSSGLMPKVKHSKEKARLRPSCGNSSSAEKRARACENYRVTVGVTWKLHNPLLCATGLTI